MLLWLAECMGQARIRERLVRRDPCPSPSPEVNEFRYHDVGVEQPMGLIAGLLPENRVGGSGAG